MPTIEIRDARPEEYDEVGDVTARGYGDSHSTGTDSYTRVLRNVADRAQSCDIVVATLDGVIVGAAAYPHKGGPYEDIAHAAHEGEFRMLTTVPEARGHSLGARLTQECLRRMRRDGRTRCVISVGRSNPIAERIYQGLGFERDPSRDWVAPDGFELNCWMLDLVRFCTTCGEDVSGIHDHRAVELEPDRFCGYCARRLQVQVLPTGTATKPCLCTTEV